MTALRTRLQVRLLRDPRLARVLHGGASGLLGRLLTLLVSALTLPLTLRYLGKLEYGIWVTVSTSVVMLSVLDLGIANTLTTAIAEAYAEDDRDTAQRYYATAFWASVGIVLLLAPVVFGLWRITDWGALFHLSEPLERARAARCVAVGIGFFLVSLPLTLVNRVLGGYQQVHLANYFNMGNSVLGLIAILATVWLKGSIVFLMAAYSAAMLLGTLSLNVWVVLRDRPWMRPHPRKVSRGMVRRLFGQGSLFFVLQLTGLVVFNSDNLVITHYLGAAAVTPYSVGWRLTQYASLLQSLLIPSLWPAFSEAYHKRQLDWIGATYRSIRQKTLTAVGVAALLIGLVGRPVIRVWAGPAAVPSRELLWLMAFFALLIATTTNQSVLLTATGRLRLEAGVAVLAAAANLALSIQLVQHMGPEGVILSTILSFLIFMIVPQAWEVKRILRGRYLDQATGQTPPPLNELV